MADTGSTRRNRIPPLAIIVVVLLGIMVLIAAVRANGVMRAGRSDTTAPIDTPDERPIMPANGQALPGTTPTDDPARTGAQPAAAPPN